MERLKVPLIRQEAASVECGLASLAMVYSLFGVGKSLEDLRRELRTYHIGTYVPQLGLHILRNGFDVEIVTRNPLLLEKADEKLNSKSLASKFIDRMERDKARAGRSRGKVRKNQFVLGYFADFINAAGKIDIKIPSIDDLESEIAQGRPVIAFLTNAALYRHNIAEIYNRPFTYTFHIVVVTGIDQDRVFINDPYWEKEGGRKSYSKDEFLYAVHSSSLGDLDNGCFIKVKKA